MPAVVDDFKEDAALGWSKTAYRWEWVLDVEDRCFFEAIDSFWGFGGFAQQIAAAGKCHKGAACGAEFG